MGYAEILIITKATGLALVVLFILFLIAAYYAIKIANQDAKTKKILMERDRMDEKSFWDELDYKS